MERLPKQINVQATVTYDIPTIVETILEFDKELTEDTIQLRHVMDYIYSWLDEDMGTGLVQYLDENGKDIGEF